MKEDSRDHKNLLMALLHGVLLYEAGYQVLMVFFF